MSRKTLLTIVAVLGAILAALQQTFGLALDATALTAALGAILLYVFFEAKADIQKLAAQRDKWKDPKFWITVVSAIIGALAAEGVNLPLSPEVIIAVLTAIVGILFKAKPSIRSPA